MRDNETCTSFKKDKLPRTSMVKNYSVPWPLPSDLSGESALCDSRVEVTRSGLVQLDATVADDKHSAIW